MGAVREDPSQSIAVASLSVSGNFMFDPAKHPDFLGAILGTGVVRGKVGDVLVQGESGAQVLCDPELVDHFEMALTQVRGVLKANFITVCFHLSATTILSIRTFIWDSVFLDERTDDG